MTSTTFVDYGATSNTCIWISGVHWLSGKVLDLGSKGHLFETHRRQCDNCVVELDS